MGSSRAPLRVDEYMLAVPLDLRETLDDLRKRLRKLVPDTVECISYGMPTLKLNGKLFMHFAAFKAHCSFFPGSGIVGDFANELKGFKFSKGTIQFTPINPIPDALLKKIVLARLAEVRSNKRD